MAHFVCRGSYLVCPRVYLGVVAHLVRWTAYSWCYGAYLGCHRAHLWCTGAHPQCRTPTFMCHGAHLGWHSAHLACHMPNLVWIVRKSTQCILIHIVRHTHTQKKKGECAYDIGSRSELVRWFWGRASQKPRHSWSVFYKKDECVEKKTHSPHQFVLFWIPFFWYVFHGDWRRFFFFNTGEK